jgi:hypothetical protein
MALFLDLSDDYLKDPRVIVEDCRNDPTEWEDIKKYQEEFDVLKNEFEGIPSPYVLFDENTQEKIEVLYIDDLGIKNCLVDPNKKCAYIKSIFCEDVYSKKMNEIEALEDSFARILDHKFYETRRANNPFAKGSLKPFSRTVKKLPQDSTGWVVPLNNKYSTITTRKLQPPMSHSTGTLLPLPKSQSVNIVLPHISPKKQEELKQLARELSRMTLRNSSRLEVKHSRRTSQSRVRSPVQTRSKSRSRSASRNKTVRK